MKATGCPPSVRSVTIEGARKRRLALTSSPTRFKNWCPTSLGRPCSTISGWAHRGQADGVGERHAFLADSRRHEPHGPPMLSNQSFQLVEYRVVVDLMRVFGSINRDTSLDRVRHRHRPLQTNRDANGPLTEQRIWSDSAISETVRDRNPGAR